MALFPIKKVTHPADIFCPSVHVESVSASLNFSTDKRQETIIKKTEDMPHLETDMQAAAESSVDQPRSLPFPPVTYSHILHCSYHHWQPK